MFKSNIFLLIAMVSLVMSSCGSNGNEAATKDAEEVEVVETNETTTLTTISAESIVDWRAAHLGGVNGRFGKVSVKDASFLVNNGTLTNATVTIDLTTLTVDNFAEGAEEKGQLTGHLLSPDFFNVETYPTAKFELTGLESTTGEYNSKATGNLTILDVTKSITFNANVKVSDNEVAIKSEDFSIDRTNWGLTYNVEGTAGVPVDYLIANDIGFTINVSATK